MSGVQTNPPPTFLAFYLLYTLQRPVIRVDLIPVEQQHPHGRVDHVRTDFYVFLEHFEIHSRQLGPPRIDITGGIGKQPLYVIMANLELVIRPLINDVVEEVTFFAICRVLTLLETNQLAHFILCRLF